MRTGLLGGTFDPPHIGHLIVAGDACELLRLDRVIFIPAREPPHKRGKAITDARLRLAMLQAAIEADARFEVSDLELQREGPSYTVDTLRELVAQRPGDTLFLLLGADQVNELATWREPEEIARLGRIVLMSREGVEGARPSPLVAHAIAVTRIGLSSTEIRDRVAAGRSIRYLVPAGVEQIIANSGLYA